MPPPWVTLLDLIRNGEAVSAEITNRPLQELGQRTDYLKALMDTLSIGQAIFDIDVAMSMDVQEGFAVYWDSAKQEYAPALAQLNYNAEGVYGGNADSAYVIGICAGKSAQTRGTVIYGGRAVDVDFSNAIEGGGTLQPGPYFLSASQPGKMTKTRPPVGIYVMFGLNTTEAVVTPYAREVLNDHIHYRLPLKYPNLIDNSGGVGWTDVYDPALAPAGAKFRYIVEQDASLYALFPFYPVSSVYFEIEGIGSNEKVIIDLNGIWWIDEFHDPDEYLNMVIYFAKPTLSTSNMIVRTLQPWTADSPLAVVNCKGEPAAAGDLYLQMNLQFQQQDENTQGWLAFKELTTSQQFKRGPIVQRVKSGSPEIGISINGTNGYTWLDDTGAPTGYLSGDLVVSYNSPTSVTRSLDPTLTELHGALQQDYNGIAYVGLPSQNFQSGVTFRFDVPRMGLAGEFGLLFNAWIYSSAAGTFPGNGLSASITIVRAVTTSAAKQLTDPGSVITITGKTLALAPNNTMNVNGYRMATLSDLGGYTIEAGDQVHITISRNDSSYAGTIGILRAWAEIAQV